MLTNNSGQQELWKVYGKVNPRGVGTQRKVGRLMQSVPTFLLKALGVQGWVSLWSCTGSSRRLLNGAFHLLCLWIWELSTWCPCNLGQDGWYRTHPFQSHYFMGQGFVPCCLLLVRHFHWRYYYSWRKHKFILDQLKKRNKEKGKRHLFFFWNTERLHSLRSKLIFIINQS